MNNIKINREEITLIPDNGRVLLRPFIPFDENKIKDVVSRVMAMSEDILEIELNNVLRDFAFRHRNIEARLLANYDVIAFQILKPRSLSRNRKLFLGMVFTGEYSLEASALFNPSIMPHPDQTGVQAGSLRFIMSLRATGEGHISSIEFRSGLITQKGSIRLDPVSRFVTTPDIDPDPGYNKKDFITTLRDMGCTNEQGLALLEQLEENFTRSDLNRCVLRFRRENKPVGQDLSNILHRIQWIADSNYEISFPKELLLSERVIFPVSAMERRGIEDTRFVRFIEEDGKVLYYATYTAYNGQAILPQLLETKDFANFKIRTLNGKAVCNKGMALFPKRINGQYAMLSRQDDENIFLMYSDNILHWHNARVVLRPKSVWELVKIGNCGSPLETKAGWVVLTHGVGPMRKYCIGAVLLDLNDPSKVLGRLSQPLVYPDEKGREGYVPNVVYSCGSLIHNGNLILPFAMSDRVTTFSRISIDELLYEMVK